jgi:hypothetical protein
MLLEQIKAADIKHRGADYAKNNTRIFKNKQH